MSNCGQCGGGGAGGVCTCFTANSVPNTQHVEFPGLSGPSGNFISTPDSAALSVTGDLEIRMKISNNQWVPVSQRTPLSKWTSSGQFSYRVDISSSSPGRVELIWSNNGTTTLSALSTIATGFSNGTVGWIKITLDVDNGAAGRDIKFYTSDDGVVYTQLGATVTQAGVTSIFDSTSILRLAATLDGTFNPYDGGIYYAEVRNGIGGPVVGFFNAEIVDATNGTQVPSVVSQGGAVWTMSGSGPSQWFWEDNPTSNVEARGNGSTSHPFNFVPRHLPNPRPCGQLARVGVVQALTGGLATAVIFNTDFHPFTGNMTNLVGAPTRLTAPSGGTYLVGGFAAISNPGAGNHSQLFIRKNGSGEEVVQANQDPNGGTRIMLSVTTLIYLEAADYIELYVFTTLGVDVTFNNADFNGTYNCPAYLWAQWMGF